VQTDTTSDGLIRVPVVSVICWLNVEHAREIGSRVHVDVSELLGHTHAGVLFQLRSRTDPVGGEFADRCSERAADRLGHAALGV
jgi:hypothetical protein